MSNKCGIVRKVVVGSMLVGAVVVMGIPGFVNIIEKEAYAAARTWVGKGSSTSGHTDRLKKQNALKNANEDALNQANNMGIKNYDVTDEKTWIDSAGCGQAEVSCKER